MIIFNIGDKSHRFCKDTTKNFQLFLELMADSDYANAAWNESTKETKCLGAYEKLSVFMISDVLARISRDKKVILVQLDLADQFVLILLKFRHWEFGV